MPSSLLFETAPIPGAASITAVWNRRAPIDVAHGSAWYSNARSEIIRRLPVDIAAGCAITAVLSPRCEWSDNLRLADAVVNGGRRDRGLERNWDKACMILHRARRGWSWEHLVTGPKVTAFYHALQTGGEGESWVIDSHMASIHHGYAYRDRLSIRQYQDISQSFESWYQTLTTTLTRAQIQATLWLIWKRRFLPHMR